MNINFVISQESQCLFLQYILYKIALYLIYFRYIFSRNIFLQYLLAIYFRKHCNISGITILIKMYKGNFIKYFHDVILLFDLYYDKTYH